MSIAVVKEYLSQNGFSENECLKYETLSLDTKRIKASVDGQEVPLTKKEFEILKLLLENKGNVFSREEILSRFQYSCAPNGTGLLPRRS